jgi:hypothetical protein
VDNQVRAAVTSAALLSMTLSARRFHPLVIVVGLALAVGCNSKPGGNEKKDGPAVTRQGDAGADARFSDGGQVFDAGQSGAQGASGGKQPAGIPCQDASQCRSGFCVDGVCCQVPCAESCTSCNLAEDPGECLPVPAGNPDPRQKCREDAPQTCGQSGLCNGQGGCAKHGPGTICKLGTCESKDRFLPASTCDGEGACVAGAAVLCAPSMCEDGKCTGACTSNMQCVAPATCAQGSCGPRGNGQDCASNDQCA